MPGAIFRFETSLGSTAASAILHTERFDNHRLLQAELSAPEAHAGAEKGQLVSDE
jgi:hypothetical protein